MDAAACAGQPASSSPERPPVPIGRRNRHDVPAVVVAQPFLGREVGDVTVVTPWYAKSVTTPPVLPVTIDASPPGQVVRLAAGVHEHHRVQARRASWRPAVPQAPAPSRCRYRAFVFSVAACRAIASTTCGCAVTDDGDVVVRSPGRRDLRRRTATRRVPRTRCSGRSYDSGEIAEPSSRRRRSTSSSNERRSGGDGAWPRRSRRASPRGSGVGTRPRPMSSIRRRASPRRRRPIR